MAALVVGCALAAGGVLVSQVSGPGLLGLSLVLLTDLPVAVGVFVAAGGWGHLVLTGGKLLDRDAPAGLKFVTCVGVGLWLLATAVLVVGAIARGALTPAVWWPVMVVGWMLAVRGSARPLAAASLSARTSWGNLIALLLGAAAGVWLTGATIAPEFIGRVTGDFYDVVSYHLQVPREFFDAGRISFLEHNTYSNYPLGGEMLFLLCMCLKGGAWAGALAAKLTHGLWGVLAVVAVYSSFASVRPWRGRTAAVLAATAPAAIYLSHLAFVELAELAYLAIGIAWLRRWWRGGDWRSAVMVGAAAGAACAVKYLSVGFVAGPLLAVMLAARVRRGGGGRLRQTALAACVCMVLFAPWLVRNVIHTGNPVFPLATGVLGRGHWTAESAARWDAGHAPPPWSQRGDKFLAAARDPRGLGAAMGVLAAVAALWTIIRLRTSDPLDWICLTIGLMQLMVWFLATHMPARFLAPAAIPLALLIGRVVADIADWRRPAWAARLAGALIVTVAGAWGLWTALGAYAREPYVKPSLQFPYALHAWQPGELAQLANRQWVTQYVGGGRLLMVGDVRPLNFPPGTLYASVWEMDPLVRAARDTSDANEIVRRLHDDYGITHLYINWREIRRVRSTYGWWDEITPELIDALGAAGCRELDIWPEDVRRPVLPDGRPASQMFALPRGEVRSEGRPGSEAVTHRGAR